MDEYLTYDDVHIVPQYSEISSRSNVDISTNLCGYDLNLPIIASPMESVMGANMQATLDNNGATGTFHRFGNTDDVFIPVEGANKAGHHPVIASIGVDNDTLKVDMNFYSNQADIILIDVAHGHHKKVKMTLRWLKENYDISVIAGNVATPEAALDLVKWGADAIRVGVGGGSVCTTRVKTGVGVPMISCIREISEELNRLTYDKRENWHLDHISIIADGGMKTPGDIGKALAAGADAVMLGSMLAGTDEAPGEIIEVDGQKMKKYYGSASREQKGNNNYVEGVSELIPHKGSVVDILDDIKDGLQSAFSYVGASNLEEFHDNAELIKVSQNGHREGKAHI